MLLLFFIITIVVVVVATAAAGRTVFEFCINIIYAGPSGCAV